MNTPLISSSVHSSTKPPNNAKPRRPDFDGKSPVLKLPGAASLPRAARFSPRDCSALFDPDNPVLLVDVKLEAHRLPPVRFHRGRRALAWITLLSQVFLGTFVSGCGYSQGEFLYMLGVGRARKIKAEFRLTESPVLILVDDDADCLTWPPIRGYIAEFVAQELLKHKAAKKIVPQETLDRLRSSMPEFAKRGCREIGRQAGADQVIWIQAQDFFASEQFSEASEAAQISVSVKVINTREDADRTKLRLWPTDPQGRIVSASMSGSMVADLKSTDMICRVLAAKLATQIAPLFYDHRASDFEHSQK